MAERRDIGRPGVGKLKCWTYFLSMLSNVFSFELSSARWSDTYASGSEVVGTSVEAVEVAMDGTGEAISPCAEDALEEGLEVEFMINR